jgi:hypothetical protein
MRTFARIIELLETQVLLIVDGSDDNEAEAVLKVMMDLGEILLTASLGFTTREAADEAFKGYTKEMAQQFYDANKSMLTEITEEE